MRQRNWTLTKKALTEAYTLIRLCWSTFPRIELHLGGFAAATADQLATGSAVVPAVHERPRLAAEAACFRALVRLPVRVLLLHAHRPAELACRLSTSGRRVFAAATVHCRVDFCS